MSVEIVECLNCEKPVTRQQSVELHEADEETKEILNTIGRFCSITCGEEYTLGDQP